VNHIGVIRRGKVAMQVICASPALLREFGGMI